MPAASIVYNKFIWVLYFLNNIDIPGTVDNLQYRLTIDSFDLLNGLSLIKILDEKLP